MTHTTALLAAAALSAPILCAVSVTLGLAIKEAFDDWRGGLGLRRNALMLLLFGTLWTTAAASTALVVAVWHLTNGGGGQ